MRKPRRVYEVRPRRRLRYVVLGALIGTGMSTALANTTEQSSKEIAPVDVDTPALATKPKPALLRFASRFVGKRLLAYADDAPTNAGADNSEAKQPRSPIVIFVMVILITVLLVVIIGVLLGLLGVSIGWVVFVTKVMLALLPAI